MKLPAPHVLARIHYVPRLLSFALTFFAGLVLFGEGAVSGAQLAYAAGVFLVYPQLVYVWSCLAADKKAAALRGLLIDAFLLGSWVAAIGFNLGIGFCLLTSVCMNNTIYRGLRGLVLGASLFAAGCGLVIVLFGLNFNPASSPGATYVGLLVLFVYVVMVASVFNSQNQLLVRAKREVDRKRLLFQGLAEAGLTMSNAGGLNDLVSGWMQHLQPLLPAGSGLGVIVRAPKRPGLTYHASFHGLDAAEQARVLAGGGPGSLAPDYEVIPIRVEAGLLDAAFILRRDHRITEIERGVVSLFVQQLGAALSNLGLTQKLTELANTDGLTGLANRSRLDERITQVIEQKRRHPSVDFSVVVVDINGLKNANDVHGHEAGDRMIRAAADALRRTCRDTDLAARMGGDEFIVVCPATTTDEAANFRERLIRAVSDTRVHCQSSSGTSVQLPLHLSIGMADSRETGPDDVVKLADQRMYADKDAYYQLHPRR